MALSRGKIARMERFLRVGKSITVTLIIIEDYGGQGYGAALFQKIRRYDNRISPGRCINLSRTIVEKSGFLNYDIDNEKLNRLDQFLEEKYPGQEEIEITPEEFAQILKLCFTIHS